MANYKSPLSILFIGNSYTGNLKGKFIEMMNEVQPEAHMLFLTPGGCTLSRHASDPTVEEAIRSLKWDYVVLQEQSRTPTFAEDSGAYQAHRRAVRQLVKRIRGVGAVPVLYETWGRRDGDQGAMKRSPDFDAMQAHLTRAYAAAGAEVAAPVVPVGQVWQAVRKADPALGESLHGADGSHASEKGSYLIAASFMRALLGIDAADLKLDLPMKASEAELVHRMVSDIVKPL